MLACDICEKWYVLTILHNLIRFHGKCVGMSERNKHKGFTCAECLRKLYADDEEEEEVPVIPNANIKVRSTVPESHLCRVLKSVYM